VKANVREEHKYLYIISACFLVPPFYYFICLLFIILSASNRSCYWFYCKKAQNCFFTNWVVRIL